MRQTCVQGTGCDTAGDILTVSGFQARSDRGAAVIVNPDGSYTYDPTVSAELNALAAGLTTTDQFTYTVSDGHGGAATAAVFVTVFGIADPPGSTALEWTNATGDGSWQTAGNWNLGFVPTDGSDVTITDQAGTVTYSDETITVLNNLDLVEETLTISGAGSQLTISGTLSASAGSASVLAINISSQGRLNFLGDQTFDDAVVTLDTFGHLDSLSGTLTLGADLTVTGSGLVLIGGVEIINQGLISPSVGPSGFTIAPGTLQNDGEIFAVGTGVTIDVDTLVNNSVITVDGGGSLSMFIEPGDNYTNTQFGTIDVTNGNLVVFYTGPEGVLMDFVNFGVINIHDNPGTSLLILDGPGTLTNFGTINSSGTIFELNGATFINSGTLGPGLSPGTLTIDGDLVQGDSAVLDIELAGTAPGAEYDQLIVSGEIEWNGTIDVTLLDGFEPVVGDSFTIVVAGSTIGELDHFGGLRFGDNMVLGTDFSDSGLTLTALQASPEHTGGAGNDVLRVRPKKS